MFTELQHEHDAPGWYAIYTHAKQEKRAESNLNAMKVETFDPLIRERRRRPNAKTAYVTKQLFPRYIFARFPIFNDLHKVRFARGVHSVVGFGERPVRLDDEAINLIRSRVGKDGLVRIEEPFKSGDKVRISSGPWANFIGVLDGNITADQRVSVLLAAVRYQAHLLIEAEAIQKIAET